MNFYMPVKLRTGVNCIAENSGELAAVGKRCIIISGKNAARKCGALDDVVSVLESKSIAYSVFDGITQNPALRDCADAGRLAAAQGAEFVIGIGGGSPLDAAKTVAVFAANPELTEDNFYAKKWACSPLPIVLVGTTAGTGSEVTNVAVLTDSKHRKHSIHDERMYAALSFGDPRYTLSLPLSITLSTGIDVLAHCTESYFNYKANEISRSFAVNGIRLMKEPLLAAARGETLSLDQRRELYEASILGGLAICVTGTCFPHNVGYYLTENYKIPHGAACAVFLPDLLEFVSVKEPEYVRRFFEETSSSKEEINALVAAALPPMDIRMTAGEIEAALPRWVNNGSVKNTIGDYTVDDVKRLLERHFI